jgi:dethiobiotin synthetase
MHGVFVTGTDTGVGKTLVATALLRALTVNGVRAVGMKPVAAGIEADATANADVLALAAAGDVDAPLDERNPYAFSDAVAPHLAAQASGIAIDLATIERAARGLAKRADVLVVEGAGGACVPIDDRHDMLDIAVLLDLPVLLVVGMRLGCLNHALLSALAIRRRGLVLAGWVANLLPPPMALADANVRTLTSRLGMPPVAIVDPGGAPIFGRDALATLGG